MMRALEFVRSWSEQFLVVSSPSGFGIFGHLVCRFLMGLRSSAWLNYLSSVVAVWGAVLAVCFPPMQRHVDGGWWCLVAGRRRLGWWSVVGVVVGVSDGCGGGAHRCGGWAGLVQLGLAWAGLDF